MFSEIKTTSDVQTFLEKTNYLHDGYIIDVRYTHKGISKTESGHYFEPYKTKLILQILVTSMRDAVVEIEFDSLFEWQIKDKGFDYIFHTSVTFDERNRIIWSDDAYTSMDALKRGSYVIASFMKWRILE